MATYTHAWQLEDGSLCKWSEPDKKRLTKRSKPSTGAEARRVVMMDMKEYRQLKAGTGTCTKAASRPKRKAAKKKRR